MFCVNCGQPMGEGQTICSQCGRSQGIQRIQNPVYQEEAAQGPMSMVWPILACFFALPPFSFLYLIYVMQGNTLFELNQKVLAMKKYKTGKIWGWWCLGVTLVYVAFMIITSIIYMTAFLAYFSQWDYNQPF